ncbi:phosphoketolase [Salirhabdus euzebyi]|uniref:Phosphoketolase n=1 Tax=Salirhabdus euzebyi TaxID=394506 RepID=A0A841Q8U3_9BACI|nr:YwpF family protein [Salirhabdus euzebyi]MBB6454828.1 phosphoketolase [Salirhabdus euzebyi]
MKTFKLVSLDVLEKQGEELTNRPINLIDGLIINREDDKNRWLIESFVDKQYESFFHRAKEFDQELVLQVKITKETNQPASLMVKIVGINEIGSGINVLFMGTLINRKQEKVEEMLQYLIEEGYQGEELLTMFKKKNKQGES